MNVCIFGDSIGKGIILDSVSKKYKSLKFDLMKPFSLLKDVSLKNYSKFGCTVTKGISIIERYAKELVGYDVALLEYGGNDCNFLWNEIALAPDKEHNPNTPIETFINTYKQAIKKIQEAGVQPVLLTLPPLHAKRFLNWVSKEVDSINILKWLGGEDMIYRWQEMYSLAIFKLSSKLGVPVVDIRSAFLCRQDLPELICEDGMHPTSKGYELIVETVCCGMTRFHKSAEQLIQC